MASNLFASGLSKVAHGTEGKKVADLATDTKNYQDSNNRETSDWGVKKTNTDDWLKVASDGKTGPMLLEDHFAREKIMRFDHERIPERVVHARGSAAFGKFTLFESASDVTNAAVLTDTSRETPLFLRFSTVLGSRGSADTVRDVRGFAVKFYTEEGNWDVVGNNIPVFFIQDAIKFPDVIHAGKPEPHNEVPQAQSAHNNFWDFQYLHTEATHMFMWTQSDRAIPRSYRMMQGFGVNTYTLTNDKGERHFVKFHFTPELGVHSFVWDEALKIAGQDPDFHRKDLMEAIDMGVYPKWKFGIQVIPEADEDKFEFDILDATKIWPEELVPIRYIGELELNRNVDEFFTQTEQVAFCTSHVVPGIGFSDDPLLQGRNFSYFDTQLSRLGINWQELPINRPVCPVMNQNRDGAMRHGIHKGTVNYWPNRYGACPPATASEGGYVEYPEKLIGIKSRLRSKKFQEHFNQAQLFYNSLSEPEKTHVAAALSFELDHCDDPVVYERMSQRLAEIDLSLAQTVAEMVGGQIPQDTPRPNHGKKAKGLSQMEYLPKEPTIASRRVAILIADGFDPAAYAGVKAALTAAKAFPFTISTRRSPIFAAGEDRKTGQGVKPDHHLEGMRSTMFDSIFIPGGADSIATLRKSGRALHWIREAFGHLKAIGAVGEAAAFVKDALTLPEVEVSVSGEIQNSYGVVTAAKVTPESFKEVFKMAKGAMDFVDAYFFEISQHRNWERESSGLNAQVAY
ncbi:Catalase [Lasiodiplodia theobromae]|uniref:Catalase n=1 Tax=Lasiodiplodia theobromae TaxID=45133 RepID=A0A5N5DS42_9PEZI|nr:Catalase [Lasiodiplodia theobromae]KAB2580838.1 Catalase-1 [Lasiodiplodia theobromae]KAF4539684.1 Catalase [Lasiodiplodia theobromae]KAF9635779.1 Catalase [Lasiodiplodia theobromae]